MNDDDLEIPAFLRRDVNNAPSAQNLPATPPTVYADPIAARQNELRAAHAERRRLKSHGRIAKMHAIRADRDAADAGMVWDAIRGGWRPGR